MVQVSYFNSTQLRVYRKASKTSIVESLPLSNDPCCFIVQKQLEFSAHFLLSEIIITIFSICIILV